MNDPRTSLATELEQAVAAIARSAKQEILRLLMRMLTTIYAGVLLLTSALVFIISGVLRLADALTGLCGQWFGDIRLGNLLVGLLMLAVPIIGLRILRWRGKRRI